MSAPVSRTEDGEVLETLDGGAARLGGVRGEWVTNPLMNAFMQYGDHRPWCAMHVVREHPEWFKGAAECRCGFTDAIKLLGVDPEGHRRTYGLV